MYIYNIIFICGILTKAIAHHSYESTTRYQSHFWHHYFHGNRPNKGHRCVTPNNEAALCVSLFTCPVLLTSLGSLHPFALDFVKKSLCDPIPNDVIVCCGTLGNFTEINPQETNVPTFTRSEEVNAISSSSESILTSTTNSATTSLPTESIFTSTSSSTRSPVYKINNRLLPSRKFCGFQHNDDRFNLDTTTALDEFPWLVHIVFIEDEEEDPEQYLDRCNGVLINNRYVLTTEYCGTIPKSVKLGQYYTNKTVTCTDNADLRECTEPILEVPIEEEVHRSNLSNGWHDFTLLRLARRIDYTEYIRPICLPLEESEIIERTELLFSGWGATEEGGVHKKRLTYKPTDISNCLKLDDKDLANATITPICLIPKEKNGELACTGDESGPLLYSSKRSQWFADSLITRVYSKLTDLHLCSNELPITGIKITMDIMNWIANTIRP